MQDNTNTNLDNIDMKQLISVLSGRITDKLTDWKNEPKVEDLMYDYNQAKSFHSAQMNKINEWLKQLNPVTDKNNLKKGRSGIAPKVIRKLAEWRYASLASSILNERNLFQVQAHHPNHIEASFQHSLILNYQFNTLIDKTRFINSLVRTLVNEGTAIIRTGWDCEIQTIEKEIPVYEYIQADEQGMMYIQQFMMGIQQEMEQTGIQDPLETELYKSAPDDLKESLKASQEYGQLVIAQNTGEIQVVKEFKQTKNRPSVQVINNYDLIVDPTCNGDFSRARFVVYKYETDMSTLKTKNQKKPDTYYNLKKIDPSHITGDEFSFLVQNTSEAQFEASKINPYGEVSDLSQSFKFKDDPRKKITVYEYWGYWDIDGTGIAQSIVATIADGKMIRLERNPFPDKHFPFVFIQYLPVKNSIYGEPDAELVGDNQQIIQALTRSMIDINARSANGQVAMPKGFLDVINKNKFNRGEDYEYNPVSHPAEAIYMHTANELPQSLIAFQQMQYAEAESITGVKSFSNGIDGNAYGQVVAGMSQAITAINQREGDIVFRISKGLEEIGNKVLAMNTEWLDEEEVIALTQFDFIKINRQDLVGDFHLEVKLKSHSESEGKAQQLTFMAQTLGADADWGLRKIMMMEIGQLYGLDTFTSAIKDYEPQPDPIAQAKAELENELLKQQIAKEQAEVQYYQARAAFIEAQIDKVQTEADLNALDFMEQQEGTKHARQRELIQAQAEAQNKGKLEAERIKAWKDLQKNRADNDTKRAVANAKKNNGQESKPTSKIPNPETDLVPKGLYQADGLGNYISGDQF